MKVKLFLWGHLSSKQCLVSLSFSTQLLASERLKAFSHFGCDWIGTRDCFSHDGGVAQGTAVLVRWSTAPVQTGIPRQLFDWWPWDSVQTLSVLEEWMCLTLAIPWLFLSHHQHHWISAGWIHGPQRMNSAYFVDQVVSNTCHSYKREKTFSGIPAHFTQSQQRASERVVV